MQPRYPVFIISKGRWASRHTMKALDAMSVPYRLIVEQQEADQYAAVLRDPSCIRVLPRSYLDTYDTCDDLGTRKTIGPGAARNYCWDLAQHENAARHWVMDDNIRAFYRLHQNRRIRFGDGTGLRLMEDFVDQYENVVHAGPAYRMFAPQNVKQPPLIWNTRVFSCHLLQTAAPFRWRARYNDDVDLSLRVLKAGFCVLQFNVVLADKIKTQMVPGGITELYRADGTLVKSRMLQQLHPDVTRIVWRFGRWHHHVNYRPFRANAPIRRPDAAAPLGEAYGLHFVADPARAIFT